MVNLQLPIASSSDAIFGKKKLSTRKKPSKEIYICILGCNVGDNMATLSF